MVTNLELHYLHRDAGNYKIFGSVVFANPDQWAPQMAEQAFRTHLIDTEFFYCTDWNIPPLMPGDPAIQGDWYEFVKFCPTSEAVTDSRSIGEFLEYGKTN